MRIFSYMKKVIVLLAAPIFASTHTPEPIEIQYEERVEQLIVEVDRKDVPDIITDADLLTALILVESRGNDSAIGDRHIVGGEAVGALQIRPVMVREVNRILKIQKSDKRFTLKDRFDRGKTIEMFLIWKNFHHKDSDPEKIARNWNGGPKGYRNTRTEKYWAKVQKELGYDS